MRDDVTFKIINVGDGRINRLNDRFARYLLAGGSKLFLIAFINAALLFEGDDRIVDLELIPGDLYGENSKTKLSILDVSAKLADGRTVDIEVQIIDRHDFRKRGPYYWAKRHALKLPMGSKEIYAQIKPTITICLLAFDLLEEEEAYRNSYSIRNDKSGNRLCADMQILYLELPKFLSHLGTSHPRTGLERWLLYFCNEESARMEKVMAEDKVLSMARDVELAFWADERKRERYFKYQKYLLDLYSDEHTYEVLLEQEREKTEQERARAEQERARAEQERARAERAEQEKERIKREMALEMLKMGIEINRIVKVSGLSEKEICGSCG